MLLSYHKVCPHSRNILNFNFKYNASIIRNWAKLWHTISTVASLNEPLFNDLISADVIPGGGTKPYLTISKSVKSFPARPIEGV